MSVAARELLTAFDTLPDAAFEELAEELFLSYDAAEGSADD